MYKFRTIRNKYLLIFTFGVLVFSSGILSNYLDLDFNNAEAFVPATGPADFLFTGSGSSLNLEVTSGLIDTEYRREHCYDPPKCEHWSLETYDIKSALPEIPAYGVRILNSNGSISSYTSLVSVRKPPTLPERLVETEGSTTTYYNEFLATDQKVNLSIQSGQTAEVYYCVEIVTEECGIDINECGIANTQNLCNVLASQTTTVEPVAFRVEAVTNGIDQPGIIASNWTVQAADKQESQNVFPWPASLGYRVGYSSGIWTAFKPINPAFTDSRQSSLALDHIEVYKDQNGTLTLVVPPSNPTDPTLSFPTNPGEKIVVRYVYTTSATPPPTFTKGTIKVNAELDGVQWPSSGTGNVRVHFNPSGNNLPNNPTNVNLNPEHAYTDQPFGSYRLTYDGGSNSGPTGANLVGIKVNGQLINGVSAQGTLGSLSEAKRTNILGWFQQKLDKASFELASVIKALTNTVFAFHNSITPPATYIFTRSGDNMTLQVRAGLVDNEYSYAKNSPCTAVAIGCWSYVAGDYDITPPPSGEPAYGVRIKNSDGTIASTFQLGFRRQPATGRISESTSDVNTQTTTDYNEFLAIDELKQFSVRPDQTAEAYYCVTSSGQAQTYAGTFYWGPFSNCKTLTSTSSNNPVPLCIISAFPAIGPTPISGTLQWSTQGNPTSCTASGGWSGSKSVIGGNQSYGPVSIDTTYTLTCSNTSGSGQCQTTVQIVDVQTTPELTFTLVFNKTSTPPPSQPVSLRIEATEGTKPLTGAIATDWSILTADTPITKPNPVTGKGFPWPASGYDLGYNSGIWTAFKPINPAFTDSRQSSLALDHIEVYKDQNGTLTLVVPPSNPTDPTLSFPTNPGEKIVVRYVYGPITLPTVSTGVTPECTLTPNPTKINKGDSVTLSWQTKHTQTAVLQPGNINITQLPSGSTSVTPQQTTTYTLSVTGTGGTRDCTGRVEVIEPGTQPKTHIIIKATLDGQDISYAPTQYIIYREVGGSRLSEYESQLLDVQKGTHALTDFLVADSKVPSKWLIYAKEKSDGNSYAVWRIRHTQNGQIVDGDNFNLNQDDTVTVYLDYVRFARDVAWTSLRNQQCLVSKQADFSFSFSGSLAPFYKEAFKEIEGAWGYRVADPTRPTQNQLRIGQIKDAVDLLAHPTNDALYLTKSPLSDQGWNVFDLRGSVKGIGLTSGFNSTIPDKERMGAAYANCNVTNLKASQHLILKDVYRGLSVPSETVNVTNNTDANNKEVVAGWGHQINYLNGQNWLIVSRPALPTDNCISRAPQETSCTKNPGHPFSVYSDKKDIVLSFDQNTINSLPLGTYEAKVKLDGSVYIEFPKPYNLSDRLMEGAYGPSQDEITVRINVQDSLSLRTEAEVNGVTSGGNLAWIVQAGNQQEKQGTVPWPSQAGYKSGYLPGVWQVFTPTNNPFGVAQFDHLEVIDTNTNTTIANTSSPTSNTPPFQTSGGQKLLVKYIFKTQTTDVLVKPRLENKDFNPSDFTNAKPLEVILVKSDNPPTQAQINSSQKRFVINELSASQLQQGVKIQITSNEYGTWWAVATMHDNGNVFGLWRVESHAGNTLAGDKFQVGQANTTVYIDYLYLSRTVEWTDLRQNVCTTDKKADFRISLGGQAKDFFKDSVSGGGFQDATLKWGFRKIPASRPELENEVTASKKTLFDNQGLNSDVNVVNGLYFFLTDIPLNDRGWNSIVLKGTLSGIGMTSGVNTALTDWRLGDAYANCNLTNISINNIPTQNGQKILEVYVQKGQPISSFSFNLKNITDSKNKEVVAGWQYAVNYLDSSNWLSLVPPANDACTPPYAGSPNEKNRTCTKEPTHPFSKYGDSQDVSVGFNQSVINTLPAGDYRAKIGVNGKIYLEFPKPHNISDQILSASVTRNYGNSNDDFTILLHLTEGKLPVSLDVRATVNGQTSSGDFNPVKWAILAGGNIVSSSSIPYSTSNLKEGIYTVYPAIGNNGKPVDFPGTSASYQGIDVNNGTVNRSCRGIAQIPCSIQANPGDLITVTYLYGTAPPPLSDTGNIKVNALLNGQPWERNNLDVHFDKPGNGLPTSRTAITLEKDYPDQPLGDYTIHFDGGGPVVGVFIGIRVNGVFIANSLVSSEAIGSVKKNSTLVFTLLFGTPPPPDIAQLSCTNLVFDITSKNPNPSDQEFKLEIAGGLPTTLHDGLSITKLDQASWLQLSGTIPSSIRGSTNDTDKKVFKIAHVDGSKLAKGTYSARVEVRANNKIALSPVACTVTLSKESEVFLRVEATIDGQRVSPLTLPSDWHVRVGGAVAHSNLVSWPDATNYQGGYPEGILNADGPLSITVGGKPARLDHIEFYKGIPAGFYDQSPPTPAIVANDQDRIKIVLAYKTEENKARLSCNGLSFIATPQIPIPPDQKLNLNITGGSIDTQHNNLSIQLLDQKPWLSFATPINATSITGNTNSAVQIFRMVHVDSSKLATDNDTARVAVSANNVESSPVQCLVTFSKRTSTQNPSVDVSVGNADQCVDPNVTIVPVTIDWQVKSIIPPVKIMVKKGSQTINLTEIKSDKLDSQGNGSGSFTLDLAVGDYAVTIVDSSNPPVSQTRQFSVTLTNDGFLIVNLKNQPLLGGKDVHINWNVAGPRNFSGSDQGLGRTKVQNGNYSITASLIGADAANYAITFEPIDKQNKVYCDSQVFNLVVIGNTNPPPPDQFSLDIIPYSGTCSESKAVLEASWWRNSSGAKIMPEQSRARLQISPASATGSDFSNIAFEVSFDGQMNFYYVDEGLSFGQSYQARVMIWDKQGRPSGWVVSSSFKILGTDSILPGVNDNICPAPKP